MIIIYWIVGILGFVVGIALLICIFDFLIAGTHYFNAKRVEIEKRNKSKDSEKEEKNEN